MTIRRRHALAAAALASLVLLACAKTPITGRKQLLLLSPQEEMKLGASAYTEAIGKEKRCADPAVTQQVGRVGRAVADVSGKKSWPWQFALLDAPDTLNAFALPGGKVAVYTGILDPAANEAGLAAIMGHEVAHAIARHGGERVSQALLLQSGIQAAGLSVKDPKQREPIMAALGVGAQVGVMMPFGRDMESEADEIGLMLMARAGYDPRQAVQFWERMEKKSGKGGGLPEFLSTHPSPGTRIADLKKALPKAQKEYAKAKSKRGVGAPIPVPACPAR